MLEYDIVVAHHRAYRTVPGQYSDMTWTASDRTHRLQGVRQRVHTLQQHQSMAEVQACLRIQAAFRRSLRERRRCVVCFEVTRTPIEWASCGHRFCTSCTDRWRALSNACPLCRATQHLETTPSLRLRYQSPVELLESFEQREQLSVEAGLDEVRAYVREMQVERQAAHDALPPPRTRLGRWLRHLQNRSSALGIQMEGVFMTDHIISRGRN